MDDLTLSKTFSGLQKRLADSVTEAWFIADEVLALEAIWYADFFPRRKQSYDAFLVMTFGSTGKGMRYWRIRSQCRAVFGAANCRRIHHEAGVWVYNKLHKDDTRLRTALAILVDGCLGNRKNPLSPPQARRVLRKTIGDAGSECPEIVADAAE